MISERIEKLRFELSVALEESNLISNPLEKLNAAISLIERTITGLNDLLETEDFDSANEEIDFFRNIKPGLVALKIEEIINYNIEVNKPIGSVEAEVNYYKQEIEILQGFFRMNAFHYQYYKNGTNSLDHHFFLRGSGSLMVPSSEFPFTEGLFSTPMSYLFAKFIAHENVQYRLRERIFELNNPDCHKFQNLNDRVPLLKWTGDLVNLVELIYGLWLTGQLNDGNASLNQIVRWIEINLQIKIGVIQRKFTEIEARKRISRTKYIDQMRENILKKIDAKHG